MNATKKIQSLGMKSIKFKFHIIIIAFIVINYTFTSNSTIIGEDLSPLLGTVLTVATFCGSRAST